MNKPCPNCGSDFDRKQGNFLFWICGTWAREGKEDHPSISPDCTVVKARVELAQLKANYNDLIMRVSRKFDGETRHQTAARYIDEVEARALKSEPVNFSASSATTEGRQDVTTDSSKQYVGSTPTAP